MECSCFSLTLAGKADDYFPQTGAANGYVPQTGGANGYGPQTGANGYGPQTGSVGVDDPAEVVSKALLCFNNNYVSSVSFAVCISLMSSDLSFCSL